MTSYSDIAEAIRKGASLDKIRELAGGELVWDLPVDQDTPLLEFMCSAGRFDLLEEAADRDLLTAEDGIGRLNSLMILARYSDSVSVLKKLLEKGADPLSGGNTAATPLHQAAALGNSAVLALLLEHVEDPDPEDEMGRTPLHYAAQAGAQMCVDMLLEKGADPLTPDVAGDTPLAMLLLSPDPGERRLAQSVISAMDKWPFDIQALVVRGPTDVLRSSLSRLDPTIRGPEGETLMHFAKRRKIASLLAGIGVPVDSPDSHGITPLMRALEQEASPRLIRWFLENGADPNARDEMGRTPLMYAADAGTPESVKILLEHGADISKRDDSRATVLFHAAESEAATAPEIIRMLVDAGAAVNARGERSETPLMAAVRARNLENARTLLELGADPRARDSYGTTALDIAREEEFEEMIELLEEGGADSTYPANVRRVLNSVDEMASLLEGVEYEAETFVLLYPAPFDPADPSRIGGAPIGIDSEKWPRTEPWVLRLYENALGEIDPTNPHMEHILTVDMRDIEDLPEGLDEDVGAVSFFVARAAGGLLTGVVPDQGNSPDNPVYRIIQIPETTLEEGMVLAEQPVRYPGSVKRRGLAMLAISVPAALRWAVTDEDTINAIASGTIEDLESYVMDRCFPGNPDDELRDEIVRPYVRTVTERLSHRTLANLMAVMSDLRVDLSECSYIGPYPIWLDDPPEDYDEYEFILQFGRDLVPEMAMPEEGLVFVFSSGALHQAPPEDEEDWEEE